MADQGDEQQAERPPGATTPGRELARLHRGIAERRDAVRGGLERAVLEGSGAVGYRQLTVKEVLERSGSNRVRFYKEFANKADCYESAYASGIDAFSEGLLATAGTAANWRAGLRRALEELAEFVAAEPLLARGLLAEVHVAGGAAMAKRNEVFERLSRAVDRARREIDVSRHSPPPIASTFILSAIEEAVVSNLARGAGRRFAAAVPSLVYLAVAIYFDSDAASEELEGDG